ncbi:MAG: TrkA-N domain-containing protein [Elusimicrobia bacterium]|nr:MAG: TrkA-N domain-containing protein [Elusimicrobiota bacterium]
MLNLAKARLLQVAGLLGLVLGAGTAGYMLVEGWGVFDSFWMTVITVATIGYGEVHPLTQNGRIFTIFLIFLGLGTTAYAFSQLTAFIVEGDLSNALRRNKMEKRIRELEQHFIVCGLGNTGRVVLEELLKTQRPLVIVEKDAEKAAELEARGLLVIHGDASHDDILEKAGITKARGIFCVLGHDQENLLLTLAARGLNASVRIVTELHDGRFRERLTRCGADAVVDSPHIGGLRLASEMVRPVTVSFLDSMIRDRAYTYRFEEVSLADASRLAGQAVSQLSAPGGRLPAIVAVKEGASGRYSINPDPGQKLVAGDVLVVLGSTEEIARLKAAA